MVGKIATEEELCKTKFNDPQKHGRWCTLSEVENDDIWKGIIGNITVHYSFRNRN